MAKITFSKLQKIKSIPDIVDTVAFEGCELKVKQYLPLEEKLQLLTNVLELSGADEGYFNLVQLEVFYRIEMIKAYTNITFSDKQMENPAKLYDSLCMNKVWEKLEALIPEGEQGYIWGAILDMAREITTYNRSFAGMLKTLTTDYSALGEQAQSIQKILQSPEIAETLKRFIPELGQDA